MTLTLCVLLWSHEGQEEALAAYEDEVLALLEDHRARLVSRVRRSDPGDSPLEVQVIDLPDEAALESYLGDPRRLAASERRDRAIAHTEIIQVAHV